MFIICQSRMRSQPMKLLRVSRNIRKHKTRGNPGSDIFLNTRFTRYGIVDKQQQNYITSFQSKMKKKKTYVHPKDRRICWRKQVVNCNNGFQWFLSLEKLNHVNFSSFSTKISSLKQPLAYRKNLIILQ